MLIIDSTEGKGENNNKQAKLVLLELLLGFFCYIYINAFAGHNRYHRKTERALAHAFSQHKIEREKYSRIIVIIIKNRPRNKGERSHRLSEYIKRQK